MKTKLFSILIIVAILLAACTTAAPSPTQIPATAPAATATEAPAKPTVAATAAPAAATAEPSAKIKPAFGPAWEKADCSAFGVPADVAIQSDCGYVTVAENRAAGNGKTIKLAVVLVHSTSDHPGTPVIEGTGSPGGAGLGGAQNILKESAGILADRDWVFFSQRGTQFAQPWLDCPAYNGMALEAVENGWSMDEELAHSKAAMQTCIDDFKAQGVDLAGYNSVENAEDINAIRQALGYDKVIYYGQSYGTLLGQFLMRSHPEIVEAIILDGIAPASAKHWTDVTDFAGAFRNVFAACARDEACHAAFPDPEGALAKGLENLKTNPPSMELDAGNGQKMTVKASESLVMNTLFLLMYVKSSLLPAAVYQFSQGNMALLSQLAPLVLSSDVARVQHLAMVCSDDPVNTLDEANLDNVPEMYRDLVRYDAVNYVNGCGLLKLPQLPDSSDELIQSDIPALLLQGGLDPATPVKAGNLVEPGLTPSYNVIVPAGAHIQLHSPCAQSIMKAFMNDPHTAPDTSCVDPKIPFTVPPAATPQPAATPAPASFGPAWETAKGETTAAGRQIKVRMAASLLADGKTLWEPVLSSVNLTAAK
jgi:pimeloyl-ACP methyl ester carboxylesterase